MRWLNSGEITLKVRSNEQNAALTSGDMMTVDMGISQNAEDQLMILNVLSNTLYTDKIAAVLREYGCNAGDANVEAGKPDTPIEVRLPNKLEPTLAIRDFGFGMTQEQILTVFCRLGRSTKRASNEFTGMLGIGSKAGFAYGDQFNVTSWTGGTRVVYSCFRDKGAPKLAKLDEKLNTGEPDGIEVKVPIHIKDIDQFVTTAERVYRYFKIPPKITGAKVVFNRPKPSQQGTGWRFVGGGHSYAIMGNVGYDINTTSLGDKLSGNARSLLQLGIELDFDTGELEIAANREGLQYKDITIKAVLGKMTNILAEVGTLFSKQVATAKTLWEAKKLYYELFQQRGSYGQATLRDVVSDKIQWNGKSVSTGRYELKGYDAHQPLNQGPNKGILGVVSVAKPSLYTRRNQRENRWFDWYARDTYHIIINDLPTKKNSPTREAGFWAANPTMERILILAFEDDKAKDTWWKKWELDGHPFTLMSTITPLKTVSASGSGAPSVHRNKHQASAFSLKETGGGDNYTQSLNWDIVTVDTDKGKGVYVPLVNFNPQKSVGYGSQASQFRVMMKLLRDAGLFKSHTKIYGFKQAWLDRKTKAGTARLGAGWEKFEDVVLAEVKAWLTGKEQAYSNYLESQKHSDFLIAKDWAAVPKGSSLYDYIQALETMKQCAHAQLFECLMRGSYKNWLGNAPTNLPKPLVTLDKLKKKALEDFPMLKLWGTSSYYRSDLKTASSPDIKLAVEYVNMVTSI